MSFPTLPSPAEVSQGLQQLGAALTDRVQDLFEPYLPRPARPIPPPGPILAQTTLSLSSPAVALLHFSAAAPGCNFALRGREASAVSVFVDGKYVATEPIFAERGGADGQGSYALNLGQLPPGQHRIELRSSANLTGPDVAAPVIASGSVVCELLQGQAAEIARYQPILVARVAGDYSHGPRYEDDRATLTNNDVPLNVRADIVGDPGAYHLISYTVAFSDEDDGTSDANRLKIYGRTTDDDWMYRVLLDGTGERVTAQAFQRLVESGDPAFANFRNAFCHAFGVSPSQLFSALPGPEVYGYGTYGGLFEKMALDQTRPFTGFHVGDRPVIRVQTGNNNFSQLQSPSEFDQPVWSEATTFDPTRILRGSDGSVIQTGWLSSTQIIQALPYLGVLSSEEVAREKKPNW